MELLERNKEASKLSFRKEIRNLEFSEMIGNMNRFFCIDFKKRDRVLVKIGKKLFKKHPEHKLLRIRIIKKGIIINYKGNSYKIGFFEKKKCYIECTPGEMSLSKEEIDMLLSAVGSGPLSQEEMDEMLTPVDYEDE
jgi:hypothetical protein